MIPKIIWQTHEYEYDGLPDTWLRNSNSWKEMNPGYDYRYISARARKKMMAEFGYLAEYEKLKNPRQKSELWRYITLLKYGGFYVDMDSICLSPLNFDHNENFLVQDKGPGNEFYFNGYFACEKGSEVLSTFCDSLLDFIRSKKDQITMREMTMSEWSSYLDNNIDKIRTINFDLYSSPILQNEKLKNIEFINNNKYPLLKLIDGLYYEEDILMSGLIDKSIIPLRKNKDIISSNTFSDMLNNILAACGLKLSSGVSFSINPSKNDLGSPEYTVLLIMNNDFNGGFLNIKDFQFKPIARSIYIINNLLEWDIDPVTNNELQIAKWEAVSDS